jgi:hypothetical protein
MERAVNKFQGIEGSDYTRAGAFTYGINFTSNSKSRKHSIVGNAVGGEAFVFHVPK